MRAVIVDNPVSYRGPYPLDRVLPVLRSAGWDVEVLHRMPGVRVRVLVTDALERGCDILVGAGGDGTLRDLASVVAGRPTALGVLPGGTTNLWARELGIPRDPERAAGMLVEGGRRPMDLGRLTLPDGRSARFMLMAGIGIDAAMLASTHPRLKRTLGAAGIAIGALGAVPAFRPFGLSITVDGQPAWEGRALQIIVGNSRRYAAVLDVTPDACVDDGLLDVLVAPSGHAQGLVRLSWSLLAHRRTRPGDAPAFRGREIAFDLDRVPALELDGGHELERAGPGRYVVAAEPGAVLAWVPRSYRGPLFSPA